MKKLITIAVLSTSLSAYAYSEWYLVQDQPTYDITGVSGHLCTYENHETNETKTISEHGSASYCPAVLVQ